MGAGQQAAFRGNITYALNRTADGTERAELVSLATQLGVKFADRVASANRYLVAPICRVTLVRDPNYDSSQQVVVRSPADVFSVLMPLIGNEPQEHLVAVILDTRNKIVGVSVIVVGTVSCAGFRCAEVFRPAILANATSIILAHNHPSGDPSPSPEDIRATEMIVAAGKLLDINVLDHLIVGLNRFVSLKERGLGFNPV